ncbi:MAG: ankyrin repeat domain-containing protein [Magnetospirillum sp.]|nr:MAG: ankyrin repeat domain-containing protein [Magnetospirillum sp.]
MSRQMVMAGAVALLLAVGTGVWWLSGHLPSPPGEELLPLPGDGLVTFARIQTEMNRAAAGKPALAADGAADPLEAIGAALREFLAGNTVKAAHLLDEVEAEIENRVPTDEQVAADPLLADKEEWLVSYFELLPELQSGKGVKADTYVFNRFAVVMRKVDSVLLAEILPTLKGYDLVARKSEPEPSVFDGMMLRFPCRLAASHRGLLEEAAKTMGKLGTVQTDCPAPKGREADFALLERIARDPASTLMDSGDGGGASPRDLRTTLMTVAAKGTLADVSKALAAGADPQRADARGRTALHYLLGNGAVTGGDRAKAIKLLY